MIKKERVLTAIRHREPDKIPKGELAIAKELADGILGVAYSEREREIEVRERLNMDLITIGSWGRSSPVGRDSNGNDIYRNSYGYEYIQTKHDKKLIKPAVTCPEEVCRFKTPQLEDIDLAEVEFYSRNTDLFVFAAVYGPESIVYDTIGFENYMEYTILNTVEMEELTAKYVEFEIAKTKKMIDLGADGVIIADDLAYNAGPFIAPKYMEILVFPYLRQMIREIKNYKPLPIFLHTDGNINGLMDRIVDCGFDGLQSLQPSAGMDIGIVKKRYGNELCLMGNIDLDYILPFGTLEQVRENVLETIAQAAPGGGYILSSCNILTAAVPPQNALAMYEAAEEISQNKNLRIDGDSQWIRR